MRSLKSAVLLAAAAGILAGCAGGNLGSSSSSLPGGVSPQARHHAHQFISVLQGVPPIKRGAGIQRLRAALSGVKPDKGPKIKPGLYAANFGGTTPFYDTTGPWQIQGYANPNSSNGAPDCEIPAIAVNGMASDSSNNLIVPAFESTTASQYGEQGYFVYSKDCGVLEGYASDTNGQPADAASLNAATGKIVGGEILNYTSNAGDVAVCTASPTGGSCTALTAPDITGYGAGVATDASGNCWMSGEDSSGAAVLEYWAGCTGTGVKATGWPNTYYGGIFFDKAGNMVDIDFAGNLYIVSGCNPACTVVGGPFTMQGQSLFGNLDHAGSQLAVGDPATNSVDVYSFCDKVKKKVSKSCLGITYLYSFNNGMQNPGLTYSGGTYNSVETGIFAKSNAQ